ncbi:helix-turn-helix transcriptional regulator [Streptomyces flaveolus]|uniref:helix-turn-helix domain-containing protein n=1 Tax=Streptomyces flaveolus TaxID=67297 RepID=UPI003448A97B
MEVVGDEGLRIQEVVLLDVFAQRTVIDRGRGSVPPRRAPPIFSPRTRHTRGSKPPRTSSADWKPSPRTAPPTPRSPTPNNAVPNSPCGASNRDIATALTVSVKTVEATLTRVYRKLGLHARIQLAHTVAPAPE